MKVLVDTPVWSLALRRRKGDLNAAERNWAHALGALIADSRVQLIGPVRQELLSGISNHLVFETLNRFLLAFPDLDLEAEDYVRAAECCNLCRRKGIQGSQVDYLICAVARHYKMEIFTTDKDFNAYSRVLGITLYDGLSSSPNAGSGTKS